MKNLENARIGLALGGGAARGWAHLGVLQALDEAGIRPACIAGTSIGSFVGATYASGGLPDLRAAVVGLDRRTLRTFLGVALPASRRLDGPFIEALMGRFVRARDVAELPLPFAAVATDLSNAQEVVLREGDLLEAIRASCGVPGLFRPVLRDGRILIDGGLANPVPVNVARVLGADLVIAVDISHHVAEDSPYLPRRRAMPNLREALLSAVAVGEVTIGDLRLKADPPDLLIRPRVGHIRFLDFTRGQEAIEAGYEAAREALASWDRSPRNPDERPAPGTRA